MGVWIEMALTVLLSTKVQVAPHAGAWIEMDLRLLHNRISHPVTRVRGSKRDQ